ncbi:DUF4192 domain-containing protein [Streptomyces sp. NPDC003717]|uniref:DUF4192 domain-containing protein n=1 Tax=Streptomyces sp. NPDC003717 TaxID=3154276 RepID=UPI0033A6970C
MTNHSETTGTPGNSGNPGNSGDGEGDAEGVAGIEHQITLRTPAELADALPYLLGHRPEDSIVLAALRDRDGGGRFGGRARLGIPANSDDWAGAAGQLVHGLVTGSERRGVRPEQMVVYLCQEPPPGGTGQEVMTRLRPLAQQLRVACGALDVPVVEALCLSDGRFWSYCCDDQACCPAEGTPMGLAGTSVLAAAATYAGVQVRGSLRELRARLLPREDPSVPAQKAALDATAASVAVRILDDAGPGRVQLAEETLALAERVMRRLAAAPPVRAASAADARDDGLLGHDEAAALILGLQDRTTRDSAAAWMEGEDAAPALRLWRALARRCVGPYGEHAAAPLTLAGWVAWSTGDELEAREALAMALGADRDYLFARLLHQACNEGLDPETIRRCLRAGTGADGAGASAAGAGSDVPVVGAGSDAPVAGTGPAAPVSESGTDAPTITTGWGHPDARRPTPDARHANAGRPTPDAGHVDADPSAASGADPSAVPDPAPGRRRRIRPAAPPSGPRRHARTTPRRTPAPGAARTSGAGAGVGASHRAGTGGTSGEPQTRPSA